MTGTISTNKTNFSDVYPSWVDVSWTATQSGDNVNLTFTCTGRRSGTTNWVLLQSGSITVNGTSVYTMPSTQMANGTVIGTASCTVPIDAVVSVGVTAYIYYTNSNPRTASASLDFRLPTISTITTSIEARAVLLETITSYTCNIWQYSFNNSTWINFSTDSASIKNYTISGLSPGATYSIYIRVYRESNGFYKMAPAISITTVGSAQIVSVDTLKIDVASPVMSFIWNVYDATYTNNIEIQYNGTTLASFAGITSAAGTNLSKTLTLTSENRTTILNAMSNAASITVTYAVSSYNNGTQVGATQTVTGEITTTSISLPTFSAVAVVDSNTSVVSVTGSNLLFVQGQSIPQITFADAEAVNGASIATYAITINGETTSSATNAFTCPEITTSGTVVATLMLTDSRGYIKTTTQELTVVTYSPIVITACDFTRQNDYDTTVDAAISGRIYPITINSTDVNAIAAFKWRYKEVTAETYGAWATVGTATVSSSSFAFTETGFTAVLTQDKSWDVEVYIEDGLTYSSALTIVPIGVPLVAYRKGMIGINNPNPTVAVDIAGTVNCTDFECDNGLLVPVAGLSSGKMLYVDSNGDVVWVSPGAMPSGSVTPHASTHAAGGTDTVTPVAIGAAASGHTHGNITSSGAVGTAPGKILTTTTDGVIIDSAPENITVGAADDIDGLSGTGIVKRIGAAAYAIAVDGTDYANASHTHPPSDITGLGTILAGKANTADLATVATTGGYNDLTGKPTIPTTTSGLTNDSGFITAAVTNLENYYTETETNSLIEDKAAASHTHGNITNDGKISGASTGNFVGFGTTGSLIDSGKSAKDFGTCTNIYISYWNYFSGAGVQALTLLYPPADNLGKYAVIADSDNNYVSMHYAQILSGSSAWSSVTPEYNNTYIRVSATPYWVYHWNGSLLVKDAPTSTSELTNDSGFVSVTDNALTLTASSWSGSSAPYTYTLSIGGLTTTDHVIIGLALSATDAQYAAAAAAKIRATAISNGILTLTAMGTKPTVAIPVTVEVLK